MDKKRDWVAEAKNICGLGLGIGKLPPDKLEKVCQSLVEAMEDARCYAEETILKGRDVRWHNETQEEAEARRARVRARKEAKEAKKSLVVDTSKLVP
jgi:hypothetical protein